MTSPQTYRSSPLGRILCDFPDCKTTFARQQEMNRHKQEVHANAKQCPWCDYEARRDQRLLAHIDSHHRPKKHRSLGDLNPSQRYEDLNPEGTEIEGTEEESPVQGMMDGNSESFGFGLSGERYLSQKTSLQVSAALGQFEQLSSPSQCFPPGNQGISKQAHPAESSKDSGFHQLSKWRSPKIASRHYLSKGSRSIAAKPSLTDGDNWQEKNQTVANQMLATVTKAEILIAPKDGYNLTSFNHMQGYRNSQPQVQVKPTMSSPLFFLTPPYTHTSFDEPTTLPYMPEHQPFGSTTTPAAFQDPVQTHVQTYSTSSTAFGGQSQVPLCPYTLPTVHPANPQPPTTSFVDGQTSKFFKSANVPRPNEW